MRRAPTRADDYKKRARSFWRWMFLVHGGSLRADRGCRFSTARYRIFGITLGGMYSTIHPLTRFEPVLRRLLDTAFGDPRKGLGFTGIRSGQLWYTEAALFFRVACLPGFRAAQHSVGALVLELEHHIRALQSGEAEARRRRETRTAATRSLKTVLQNRQLVLRRLVDAFLWVLVLPNWWILRRWRVEGGIKRIDPATLKPVLRRACGTH